MYRLDRTAFEASKLEEERIDTDYWRAKSVEERLRAAMYLQSINYNFKLTNLPKMDRSIFSMTKRG